MSGTDDGSFWVFGYGSLMWRPGFRFIDRQVAVLAGYHRALCIYSIRHRGTIEEPGLVFGLDRGGSCRGIAYRVAAADREVTLAYLTEREQINGVYHPVVRRLKLMPDRRPIDALCYVVDRTHEQFAGRLPHDAVLERVARARGQSGANIEYVCETVRLIEAELGIRRGPIHAVARDLEKLRERLAAAEPGAIEPQAQRE